MPVHVEVLPTDKIGYLYNRARKEVEDFFPRNCDRRLIQGLITTSTSRGDVPGVPVGQSHLCEEVGKLSRKNRLWMKPWRKPRLNIQANRNDQSTRNEARTGATPPEVPSRLQRAVLARVSALRSIVRAWGTGRSRTGAAGASPARSHLCGEGKRLAAVPCFPQENHRQDCGGDRQHACAGLRARSRGW